MKTTIRAMAVCLLALLSQGLFAAVALPSSNGTPIISSALAAADQAAYVANLNPKAQSAIAARLKIMLSHSIVSISSSAIQGPVITVPVDGNPIQFTGAVTTETATEAGVLKTFSVWKGTAEATSYTARFVTDQATGQVFGEIHYKTRVFKVLPIDATHQSFGELPLPSVKLKGGTDWAPDPVVRPPYIPPVLPPKATALHAKALGTSPGIINILYVYSPAAVTLLGSGSLSGESLLRTDEILTATSNSGYSISISIGGSFSGIRSDYDVYSSHCSVTNAATYDGLILQARDNAFADVVLIMNDPSSDTDQDDDGCAQQIGATPHTAFASASWLASVGVYSMTHEFGHLTGARHQTTGGVSGNDTNPTPYAYGHGYLGKIPLVFNGGPNNGKPTGTNACFHTIMAEGIGSTSNCDTAWPDRRVEYFSTTIVTANNSGPFPPGLNGGGGGWTAPMGVAGLSQAGAVVYNAAYGNMWDFHITKLATATFIDIVDFLNLILQ